MYNRFLECARKAMVLAKEEARGLGHDYIGTEHILLGLMADKKGLASKLLRANKVSPNAVRDGVAKLVRPGPAARESVVSKLAESIGRRWSPRMQQPPFRPTAKLLLELSMEEARSLGHDYVSSGHLLLGLMRVRDGGWIEDKSNQTPKKKIVLNAEMRKMKRQWQKTKHERR